ncbi:MAG: hypothetical protein ACYCZN_11765 [Candidatus Dormibacteria bacterium]
MNPAVADGPALMLNEEAVRRVAYLRVDRHCLLGGQATAVVAVGVIENFRISVPCDKEIKVFGLERPNAGRAIPSI